MSGFPELILILVILFIVFGARTMPRLGEMVGRALVKRRRASTVRRPEPPGDSPMNSTPKAADPK